MESKNIVGHGKERTSKNLEDGCLMAAIESRFVGRTVRFFMSYSSHDKVLASGIKDAIERDGSYVFMAHEDIEPSASWREVIMRELLGCDVFIPVITKQFASSKWTDQETGVALAKGMLIIPIKVDVDPYGFIGEIQALSHLHGGERQLSRTIHAILLGKEGYAEGVKDGLIRAFAGSSSWDRANELAGLLEGMGGLTDSQANEIVRAAAFNVDIYKGWRARPFVEGVYEKMKPSLDDDIVDAFSNTIAWLESEEQIGVSPDKWLPRPG